MLAVVCETDARLQFSLFLGDSFENNLVRLLLSGSCARQIRRSSRHPTMGACARNASHSKNKRKYMNGKETRSTAQGFDKSGTPENGLGRKVGWVVCMYV